MKNFITGFINIFKREIEFISKDVDIIIIILLSPMFYALFYGSTYIQKSETNVPIAVIDMDRSDISRKFTSYLDSHQLVNITETLPDFASAQNKVYAMEDYGIVYIPEDFSENLKSGKQTNLKIYLNTSRFLISNDINKAVNEVAQTMAAGIRIKYFQRSGYSYQQSFEMYEPIQLDIRSLYNTTESYGDFLIPASLILILQQTLLMGLAESVAKEREEGSFYEMEKAGNYNIWGVIMGKGAPYILIYSVYFFFFFSVNFSIFKLFFLGNSFVIALLTFLFLSAIGMGGVFIASFFKRKALALQMVSLTSFPFFFVSGYSWPLEYMPGFIQAIAYFLPTTPYYNAFVRVSRMEAGLADVVPQLIHLTILLLLGIIAAGYRYKSLWKKEALIAK
ncbi:MAG TPA: ABC transporter permease [Ignavibacteriales bacterium]|nr:ABC transporter permease [Ignavibacteriales bacterium]